jgi:phosphopantothenoylcysteine decarboxylase / phosphopantothenate---cysteine ligase
VVGFAAETDDLEAHARAKLAKKGCDWIVANDVSPKADGRGVFGADDNAVKLVTADGVEDWGAGSKLALARRLAQRIVEALAR